VASSTRAEALRGEGLKNILMLMVIIVAIATVPVVDAVVAVSMSLSEATDVSGRLDSSAQSEHGHHNQDSDCCHSDCACCLTQGSLVKRVPVHTLMRPGIAPWFESTNLQNPHLDGLLRPPRFS
jgi:hypothetical protein